MIKAVATMLTEPTRSRPKRWTRALSSVGTRFSATGARDRPRRVLDSAAMTADTPGESIAAGKSGVQLRPRFEPVRKVGGPERAGISATVGPGAAVSQLLRSERP